MPDDKLTPEAAARVALGLSAGVPECAHTRWPHQYDPHEGECELDHICHQWESGRRETYMDERDKMRNKLHANPALATLIQQIF